MKRQRLRILKLRIGRSWSRKQKSKAGGLKIQRLNKPKWMIQNLRRLGFGPSAFV